MIPGVPITWEVAYLIHQTPYAGSPNAADLSGEMQPAAVSLLAASDGSPHDRPAGTAVEVEVQVGQVPVPAQMGQVPPTEGVY